MSPTDEQLRERIVEALRGDDRVAERPIDVDVVGGLVELRGTVQSHRRKLAAQEIASAFDGCRDVLNRLEVDPAEGLNDDMISRNVSQALSAAADVPREHITVSVRAGRVTLSGQVASAWERTVAEDVALAARGVVSVDNLLIVDLAGAGEDQALSIEIAAALRQSRGLTDCCINVSVSAGTVTLQGEVATVADKQLAEQVARRFRAHTVRNQLAVRAG